MVEFYVPCNRLTKTLKQVFRHLPMEAPTLGQIIHMVLEAKGPEGNHFQGLLLEGGKDLGKETNQLYIRAVSGHSIAEDGGKAAAATKWSGGGKQWVASQSSGWGGAGKQWPPKKKDQWG